MQYPLISEYVRAMQDPAGNLDQLAHMVPVLDDHGEPMRNSGAFAVVFKMGARGRNMLSSASLRIKKGGRRPIVRSLTSWNRWIPPTSRL